MPSVREYNFNNVGVETGVQPTPDDPSSDGDYITKGFADRHYHAGNLGVADLTALAAIAFADRFDNMAVYVKSVRTTYYFDSGSGATADGVRIVEPSSGSGRWFRHVPSENQVTGDQTVDNDLAVGGDVVVDGTLVLPLADPEKLVALDGTGNLVTLNVSDDEASCLAGVHSPIQDQLDDKMAIAVDETVTGQKTFDKAIGAKEISTPSNPTAGYQRIYPKADGKWYTLNSSGIEQQIGSGSGSGGINYLSSNPGFETDTSGYSTFADAAASTPVDLTGGTPNSTIARSTSSPLRGSASLTWTKSGSASRQGEGFSAAFTMDAADVSKPISISFDVDATDTNYTDDEMTVWIYDVTNATLIYPAFQKIKKAKYTFKTTFVASTSTSYRLGVFTSGTSTANYTLKFDNFQVGPVLPFLGVPVEEERTFSGLMYGSSNLSSYTDYGCYFKRVGNTLWVSFRYKSTTDRTDTNIIRFRLPNNLTIDTTKLGDSTVVGAASYYGGTTYIDAVPIVYDSTGTEPTKGVAFIKAGTSTLFQVGDFDNNQEFSGTFCVPVAEWAGSSVYLSQARPEYAYNTSTNATTSDTTSFGYGPNGNTFGSITASLDRRVRFLTPIQPTDQIIVQVDNDGNGQWSSIGQSSATNGNVTISNYQAQNTATYGFGSVKRVSGSTTDIDVQFGAYRYAGGATYGAAGAAWSGVSNARWRVVKIPGQVQVASPTTSKYQTKTAPSDVTTNSAVITFSNLVIGRTYRVSGKVVFNTNNTDKYAQANLTNGSTTIDTFIGDMTGATTGTVGHTVPVSTGPFVATATTVTLTGVSLSSDAYIQCDGTRAKTYLTLEELSTHTPTTEWT